MIGSRLLFADQVYADRFLREYRQADGFEVFFDLLTPEWFESLPSIDMPSVVLWGAKDRILSAVQAGEIAAKLDGAERRVIEGWGHYPMIEQPDHYAEVVVELTERLVGTI